MQPQMNLVQRLVHMLKHTWAVFTSRQTPWYVKVILALGLLYTVSPYDLIPEWIPVVGVLDDVALAAFLITWAQKFQVTEE